MKPSQHAQFTALKKGKHQLTPDGVWVQRQREVLLSRIKKDRPVTVNRFEQRQTWMHLFVPQQFIMMARSAMLIFLVLGLTVGGWTVGASASYDSLPGDALWGVKLATEKTQIAVASITGDKEKKASLLAQSAGRRANEVKKVIEQKSPDVANRVNVGIEELKRAVNSTHDAVQDVKQINGLKSDKVAEVVKVLNEASKELKNTSITLETFDTPTTASVQKKVSDAKEVVDEASLGAVEVLVEQQAKQQQAGDSTLSDKDVKTLVEAQITKVLDDHIGLISGLQQVAATVTNNAIASAASSTLPLVSSPTSITTGGVNAPIPSLGTSTVGVGSVSSTVPTVAILPLSAQNMKDVVQKAGALTGEAKNTTAEAQTLVDSNQFLEAIQKVRVLTQDTKNVKTAIEEVKTALGDSLSLTVPSVATTTAIVVPSTSGTATKSPHASQ